jgi:hypothetical protein
MKKTSGKYDFKYTLSNLQHQDHKITTNNDTSSNSLGFPHIKPFKGSETMANLKS